MKKSAAMERGLRQFLNLSPSDPIRYKLRHAFTFDFSEKQRERVFELEQQGYSHEDAIKQVLDEDGGIGLRNIPGDRR